MDGPMERPDRLSASVRVVSALGRSVSTLLAEMEHELRLMAADVMQPADIWADHRPAVQRTRRPGFRPRRSIEGASATHTRRRFPRG